MPLPLIAILVSSVNWAIVSQMFTHAMKRVDPISVNYLKIAVALVCFLATFAVAGLYWPGLKSFVLLMISGSIGFAIADSLVFFAFSRIGAARSMMMALLGPLSLAFLSWIFLDRPLTLYQLSGLASMAGCLMMLAKEKRGPENTPLLFLLMAVAGYILDACGVFLSKYAFETNPELDVLTACTYRTIGAFISMTMISHMYRHKRLLTQLKGRMVTFLVITSVFGNYASLLLYLYGVKHMSQPAVVLGLGGMTPVYSAIYEHWRDRQWPNRSFFMALCLMLIGVGLIIASELNV